MVLTVATAVVATACAPIADNSTAARDTCAKDSLATLYPGIFTFGTDQPVYPPWYMGDNPASGEGFEAALAFAVADQLGYREDEVRWVRVPFNGALAPGPKVFDANLSEFSITEQRKAAVDFSSPYFDVTQAIVTTKSSPGAGVKTLEALKTVKLGVQVGTTSFTAATSVEGTAPVEVYNTNGDAKLALSTGEIDALVADLPTAFAVANELPDGLIVGQLPTKSDDVEQFGIVLDKGSLLTRCVSSAVDALRENQTLERLEREWLAGAGNSAGARLRSGPRSQPCTLLADEPRQPGRQMRHQAAVGVDAFLDVGQVAALDDAVEPLGPADQHPGLAARQRVGGQLPRRLVQRTAVEQLDVAGGMGEQKLDGLGLGRVGGIVDEPPEPGLPQRGLVILARSR